MADDNDLRMPARDFNAEAFLPGDLLETWIRPLLAEFIGPFALVFMGAGAIMTASTQGYGDGGTLVMVALAYGLAVALMTAGAGHISGGHYNPAVTVALFIGGKIGAIKSVAYIIVQLAGAVFAAILLKQIFDESNATLAGAIPSVNYDGANDAIIVGRQNAIIVEVVATFFLVYVICGTSVDSRGHHAAAPLAIGLAVTMGTLMAYPLTGAAMNPARHFGPALIEGEWKDAWIYWVAPIVGGALASIVHNYVFIPRSVGFPDSAQAEHR
jgi:aquaporin Z